jgi:Ca2+-binding EF-hand superfamily protein
MRTVLAVACVLAIAPAAIAQNPPNAARFREVFLQLDANADTVIERDEVPESGRAAFDRLLKRGDTNKDGKLQLDEIRGLGQKVAVLADPEVVAERFRNMDKDKDGKVARSEFTGLPANFDKIDADKDGSLSSSEIDNAAKALGINRPKADADAPKPPKADAPAAKPDAAAPGPLQRFKALDKDGDGKLSAEEFPRPVIFKRLDTDKDGFLSREELAKFRKPGE